LHAEGDREALAPGDFVAEDEQQQILMRHLLLMGEHEPLRQDVEDQRQLQASQHAFQIRIDDLSRHCESSPSDAGAAGGSGSAYWVAGRR
jgi:hypothetical protein